MAQLRRIPRYGVIAVGLLILLIIVIVLRLFALLTAIPEVIGNRISLENRFRRFVYWLVNVEEVERFRDDVLLMMTEHVETSGETATDLDFPTSPVELDEWGLVRLIEQGREDAKRQLREGEFILSFVGTITTIIVSQVAGLAFAGLLLTVLLVVFSFVVSARIVVTDLLAYKAMDVERFPKTWLVMMAGWNQNQIGHNTSMMIAAIFIVFSTSGMGYDLGIRILDWYGNRSHPVEEKRWRVNEQSPYR